MLKDRSSRKYNRWAWRKDNGGWTDYTQEQTCCLEKAFVEERPKEVVIDDIRIDMNCRNQLWQRVISDPSKQQLVRRHPARVHAKMWVPAVGEAAQVFSASNNKWYPGKIVKIMTRSGQGNDGPWTMNDGRVEIEYDAVGGVRTKNVETSDLRWPQECGPGDDVAPKVFVVAAKEAGGSYEPQRLRNYRSKLSMRERWTKEPGASHILGMDVWQAGRATSAAPAYFPPFSLMPPSSEEPVNRGPVFVDGGIVANNPVMVALKEAMSLWPGREVGCIDLCGWIRRWTTQKVVIRPRTAPQRMRARPPYCTGH